MFLGERIRQAREIRGLSQDELAQKLGRSKALVAQVEAGFKLPTDEFVESVADATELPITFFNEPPHAEFPLAEILLRAQRTVKRREVLSTVRYAEHVYAVYAMLPARLKPIPVRIPEVLDSSKEAAWQVRNGFGIEPNVPIPNLTSHLKGRASVSLFCLRLVGEKPFVFGYEMETETFRSLRHRAAEKTEIATG